MKKPSKSEKLRLDEITQAAHQMHQISGNLSIGQMIEMIRNQLGMSQSVLAQLAKVPQSTISRVENTKREPQLWTIKKILHALSCELIIVPLLKEPIDILRRKQARRIAEKNARYLRGTMSLEKQEPDKKLIEELIEEEEEELLQSAGSKLWQG